MQLKCKINNRIYDVSLIQGIPFSEEYNETLDSASIIIDQVTQIKNINPYDDVYIYDGDFYGFDENGNVLGTCTFYKHFLIDQINEEILILNTNELEEHGENKNLYKYKIQLFSETKGLETIQLPNISITQPLNPSKKISIYQYLEQFINMYSPQIKVAVNEQDWEYKKKYKLDNNPEFVKIFDNCYSPDFTLNSPNLRDVLSKFMIVKDMIPYVENNVIKGLDITKRTQEFDLTKGEIGYIYGSLSSANYADNLKTNYIDALSQDKTCKMVEYLGFRNSNSPLMKISDLRLETGYPIYKINKVLMCYYKKCKILTSKKNEDGSAYTDVEQKAFLCKQDITKLVKLNSERNLLSKDFNELMNESDVTSIDDMAKYRVCTVGYDIGSKYITGWGEKFNYIKNDITWWNYEKTYIENIAEKLDQINAFGTYTYGYVAKDLDENQALLVGGNLFSNILSDTEGDNPNIERGTLISPFTNVSSALKGFFFQVEYDGFYNGTVLTTKDGAKSDIVINDNQSNSLPLLEEDGLAKKEKINRFGNKGYTISVRYKNIQDLQPLGSYFPKDDVVIYHREYTINANVINCTYYGMKDYVLKNFFTSVYAKHRPYNLMSYEESITRAENKKNLFLLSKNEQYYEDNQFSIQVNNIEEEKTFNNLLFSCFNSLKQENVPAIEYIKQKDRINYAYINSFGSIYDKDGNKISEGYNNYASDINAFVNGNSLCFNLKMYDNVSMGVYINQHEPFDSRNDYLWNTLVEPQDSISGSQQNWYMTVDDLETGFSKEMGFYVCHLDQQKFFSDELMPFREIEDYTDEASEALETYYNNLFKLPLIDLNDNNYDEKNVIGNTFEINKDNKEIIDMTYQFEPITSNDDILFSPLFFKLSDLYGNYNKFEEDLEIKDKKILDGETWYEATLKNEFFRNVVFELEGATPPGDKTNYYPVNFWRMSFTIDKEIVESEKTLQPINFPIVIKANSENASIIGNGYRDIVSDYELRINKIEIGRPPAPQKPMIYLTGSQIVKYTNNSKKDDPSYGKITEITDGVRIVLTQVEPDNFYYNQVEEGKMLFSNVVQRSSEDKAVYEPYFEIVNNIYFGANNYTVSPLNCELGTAYPSQQQIIFAEEIIAQNAKYAQNMFVVGQKEKLKKNLVYDEETKISGNGTISENILSNVKLSDVFKVEDNVITINLKDISDDIQSLQYWYLDGVVLNKYYQPDYTNASYKFVFGVNLTEQDFQNGEVKIFISQLSSLNKKVYDENYNLIGEMANICSKQENVTERKIINLNTSIEENRIETYFSRDILDSLLEYKYYSYRNPEGIVATFTYSSEGSEDYKQNVAYRFVLENDAIKLVTKDENALLKEIIFTSVDEEECVAYTDISHISMHYNLKNVEWQENEIEFNSNPYYGRQFYTKYN